MSPSLRYYMAFKVWESMQGVYEAFGHKVPAPDPDDYRCEQCNKYDCEHYPEYF